jgi:hypothetical protein
VVIEAASFAAIVGICGRDFTTGPAAFLSSGAQAGKITPPSSVSW